jgi:hypothetical protein
MARNVLKPIKSEVMQSITSDFIGFKYDDSIFASCGGDIGRICPIS